MENNYSETQHQISSESSETKLPETSFLGEADGSLLGILKQHKKILQNHFENQQLPNEILQSLQLIKTTFIKSRIKLEKEQEERIERLNQNSFQLLDKHCLENILYSIPNYLVEDKSKILDLISFSRTCKQFYNSTQQTFFQIEIKKKKITIPFQIYQYIVQIPNRKYKSNVAVFNYCAENNLSTTILPTLNQFGYDINKLCCGISPLMYKLIDAHSYDALAWVKSYVDLGADVNQKCTTNTSYNWTPLHLAVSRQASSTKLVKFIISSGANVNLINNNGENCLHIATSHSKIILVKYFISLGMDPNIKNAEGNHCLLIAIKRKDIKLFEYLISININPNTQNNRGNTALMESVRNKNVMFLQQLLSLPNIDLNLTNTYNDTAFDIAQQYYYPPIIDLLQNYTQKSLKEI